MNKVMIRWSALAVAFAAAGCSDATGPNPSQGGFDAQRVRDGVAAIERVNGVPVLESFRSLGGQIGAAGAPNAVRGVDRLVGVVRGIVGTVTPMSTPGQIPVIRSGMLGKTMTYDAATKQYVVSNRAGAPANGVRFVLYENDATKQPNPAKEVGYSDLLDVKASSSTTAGLKLQVVSNGTTYLEYSFDLSGSIASATVNVAGFMSDGTERVNFDLVTTGQLFGRGGRVTVDAKIAVPSKQFSIDAKLAGTAGESDGSGDVDITVKAGTDVVELDATFTPTQVDATVKANGKLFATIKGSPETPVIKGEGGRDLTADELAALGTVFEFAKGVFELIAGLLAPAGALLLLGLAL